MTMTPLNYALLLVPFCISLGVLALILMLREYQHQQIQKGLIDRLLVSQGHNPLPDIEPIAELKGEARQDKIDDRLAAAIAKIRRERPHGQRVQFGIPGMPPRAGMGEVKK